MYIDSSQTVGNDSMQVVAKLLRDTLEPIIKVSCGLNCGHVTESTHDNFNSFLLLCKTPA